MPWVDTDCTPGTFGTVQLGSPVVSVQHAHTEVTGGEVERAIRVSELTSGWAMVSTTQLCVRISDQAHVYIIPVAFLVRPLTQAPAHHPASIPKNLYVRVSDWYYGVHPRE